MTNSVINYLTRTSIMHVEHVKLEDIRVAARQRRERRLRPTEVAVDEPAWT